MGIEGLISQSQISELLDQLYGYCLDRSSEDHSFTEGEGQ